jgi:hypothetical protein
MKGSHALRILVQLPAFLLATAFLAGAPALGEGGHTGNGGGTIVCDGQAPLTHDYSDAFTSGDELLPIQKMGRDKFFKTVLKRLAKMRITRNGFLRMVHPQGEELLITADLLRAQLEKQGPADTWPITPARRTLDEAASDLPAHCRFVQAAINEKGVPYQIREVVSPLAPIQKWVLELHEAIYVHAIKVETFEPHLTSRLVRNLVAALIKKKTFRGDIELALLQLYLPDQKFDFFGKTQRTKPLSVGYTAGHFYPLSKLRGAFYLQFKRGSTEAETDALLKACPAVLTLSPTGSGDVSVVGLKAAAETPELVSEFLSLGKRTTARGWTQGTLSSRDQASFQHQVDEKLALSWTLDLSQGSLELVNHLQDDTRCGYVNAHFKAGDTAYQAIRDGQQLIEDLLNGAAPSIDLDVLRTNLSWPGSLFRFQR